MIGGWPLAGADAARCWARGACSPASRRSLLCSICVCSVVACAASFLRRPRHSCVARRGRPLHRNLRIGADPTRQGSARVLAGANDRPRPLAEIARTRLRRSAARESTRRPSMEEHAADLYELADAHRRQVADRGGARQRDPRGRHDAARGEAADRRGDGARRDPGAQPGDLRHHLDGARGAARSSPRASIATSSTTPSTRAPPRSSSAASGCSPTSSTRPARPPAPAPRARRRRSCSAPCR